MLKLKGLGPRIGRVIYPFLSKKWLELFFKLVALLWTLTMLPGLLLLTIGAFGPFAFLAVIAVSIALPSYAISKRHGQFEFDDKLGWERMSQALDDYVREVKERENGKSVS